MGWEQRLTTAINYWPDDDARVDAQFWASCPIGERLDFGEFENNPEMERHLDIAISSKLPLLYQWATEFSKAMRDKDYRAAYKIWKIIEESTPTLEVRTALRMQILEGLIP